MNNLPDNTFNGLQGDAEVESRARAVFRTACENVDSYHALRLGLARRKALNAAAPHPSTRLWAPIAGGAMACCALAIGVALMRPDIRIATTMNVASSAPIAAGQVDDASDDLPEVASTQMEMVQDLDFYRWLAAQPSVASAPRGGNR
ncbi:MAG TPA: hypothetical protein VFI81_10970 [Rhodanobacteraceae bacterium]|nr:hypothetical protein [Rhodanobacteraceae bacterium]